jgi:predicted MPP superfamily phosphohydrolase
MFMKMLIPILFLILFLGLLTGGDIYLSKRFAFFFSVEKTGLLYITFTFLIVFMLSGMFIFMNRSSVVSSYIYTIAAVITGIMLYLLLSTILFDLLNFLLKMPPKVQGLLSLSFAVLISLFGIWNASKIRISERDVVLSGLTENLKAVHLSDIHLGHIRGKGYLEKTVKKVNEQDPDLIFITGDLFDGKKLINKDEFSPMQELNAPVFFVEGNHDVYSDVDNIKAFLKNQGIHVLENEIELQRGIQIVGLNHMRPDNESADIHAPKGNTIKDVLQTLHINKKKPSVLLHHSPDGIQYANKAGIDLYLSGHTHGGQLFPGNLIVNLVYKYSKGEAVYKNTKIIVSQGSGTWGPPMRVGTKSEIIVLNLLKDTNQ